MWAGMARILLVVGFPLVTGGFTRVPPPTSSAVSTEHRPLSATVWATIAVNDLGAELVVLWRGTPGWYMKQGPRAEHASGNSESLSVSLEYAGTRVSMSYDRRRREATVGTKAQILPPEVNTIFVDKVDDPSGPTIVGFTTLRLSRMMTNVRVAAALSQSSAAVTFLQCEGQWNEARNFAGIAKVICGELGVRQ
jgi:hypothetical protein